MEIRKIPGYENFFASDCGKVFLGGKELNQSKMAKKNYLRVNAFSKKLLVHRLVLAAFTGEFRPGMECRHLDGNHRNNRACNLKWGTSKENANDRRLHGTSGAGEKNPMAKLTNDQVELIRFCKGEASADDVSNYFLISRQYAKQIINEKVRKL